MSLHMVDKDGIDRNSPSVNTHDTTSDVIRSSHQTLSTTPASPGTKQTTRVIFKNNVILYYDDQNRVIRVDGFISGLANFPITIIARYGYDVYSDILGLTPP